MATLKAIEETLAQKVGIFYLRRGKGGDSGAAQEDSREPEAARFQCMGESVQASPNLRKAWPTAFAQAVFSRSTAKGSTIHPCQCTPWFRRAKNLREVLSLRVLFRDCAKCNAHIIGLTGTRLPFYRAWDGSLHKSSVSQHGRHFEVRWGYAHTCPEVSRFGSTSGCGSHQEMC